MKPRVGGWAAALLLVPLLAGAGEVPRSAAPPTMADVTLVEYEVIVGGGTPASEVAATLRAIAKAVRGTATNVDGSSGHGIITLPKSGVAALTNDRRLASVKEAAPGASGRKIVHLKAVGNVSPPWTEAYGYDGAGNITQIGNDSFAYDGVSRLTSATVKGDTQTCSYDAYGNRTYADPLTGKCAGGVDCAVNDSIASATNRINSGGTSYDVAGNVLTLDSAVTFTWDAMSVMTSRSDGGGRQFLYDANDERIGTYYPNGTWGWTIRDTGNRVVSEYTSSGTTGAAGWTWQRDHVFRGGELVAAMTASGSTLHYHLDHLGTPRLITSNGVEAAFHTYLPFGAELSTAPVESPKEVLTFTGHEFDDLGSVYSTFYMHARSDSAMTGRFLSVDPDLDFKPTLQKPQKWNRYAYVVNNPILYHDPTGRQEHAGFAMDRDVQDLLNHRITEKEYWSRLNARGVGAAIGVTPWVGLWGVSMLLEMLGVDTAATAAAASGPVGETVRRVMADPNKVDHIFGNPEHMLGGLVERFGSAEGVVGAVGERLYEVQQAGSLATNANGVFQQFIMVGGELVEVQGRVIDGVIRIGNFWVPKI